MEEFRNAKFEKFKTDNYLSVQQSLYRKSSVLVGFNENYVVSDDKIEAELKIRFNDTIGEPAFFNEFAEIIKARYIAENGLEPIFDNIATVFFIIDEAGNVKLAQLRQDTGVGRGRRMSYILFYHSISQIFVQFGKDYGETLLGTVALRIFLPGLEGETAKYASFICRRTTTLQKSGTDSNTDAFDSSRLQETGRDLRTEDEIRTLAEKHQALIVASSLDPMLAAFPPLQTKIDKTVTHPESYSVLTMPPVYEQFKADAHLEFDMNDAYALAATDIQEHLANEYQAGDKKLPIEAPDFSKTTGKTYKVSRSSKIEQPVQTSFENLPAGNLALLNANAQKFAGVETRLGFEDEKPSDDDNSQPPKANLPFRKTATTRTRKIGSGEIFQPQLSFGEEDTTNLLKAEDEKEEAEITAQSQANNDFDDLAQQQSTTRLPSRKKRLKDFASKNNQLQQ